METIKQFDICSLGSASNDITMLVPRFPVEGETLQALEVHHANGGKGANTAVSAARLNAKTLFAGQLGCDSGADKIIYEMNEAGVNLGFVRKVEEVQTGLALIFLNPKRENSIVIIGGANIFYKDVSVLPEEYKLAIKSSSILMLQREITQEINILAAQYAQENNTLVVLDYGGRDEPLNEDLLKNLDFMSPNETELARFLNKQENEKVDVDNLKKTVLDKHKNLRLLIKLGSKGSQFISNTIEDLKVPAVTEMNKRILQENDIVDTTGAGDCYTAAFFTKYKELIFKNNLKPNPADECKDDIEKCMLFASSCAFVCITKMGAMTSQPKRSVVEEFISKYL